MLAAAIASIHSQYGGPQKVRDALYEYGRQEADARAAAARLDPGMFRCVMCLRFQSVGGTPTTSRSAIVCAGDGMPTDKAVPFCDFSWRMHENSKESFGVIAYSGGAAPTVRQSLSCWRRTPPSTGRLRL